MSDVRELLARDGLAAAPLGSSHGGTPELTVMDVRAALGMTSQGIGRELLEWLYASGRTRRTELPGKLPRKLDSAIVRVVYAEKYRLDIGIEAARLELNIMEDIAEQRAIHTAEDRQEIARLRSRANYCMAKAWPHSSPAYAKLREAVVHEIDGIIRCKVCGGRGEVPCGELRVKCSACQGRGKNRVSGCERALWLGINESSYRRQWKQVYEWLYNRLNGELLQAITDLRAAIGR